MTHWLEPPESPTLAGGEIHIWRINIGAESYASSTMEVLHSQLTASEQERANRFLAEKHRGRFVVGRAKMRQILSRYVRQPPNQIALAFENLGKPYLADPAWHAVIRFNFSNSADLAILALAAGQSLGVDVERIRPMSDMLGLANRYFAPSESQALFALPDAQRADAFFRLWTRKEAWLKAIGKGLTFPLRDVEVTFDDTDCRVLAICQDTHAASDWDLIPFLPDPDHVAAVALKRTGNEPRFFSEKTDA